MSLESGGTQVLAMRELCSVAGDELHVTLATPGQAFTLSRLGADAALLLAELRARWLPARARALRLLDASDGWRFAGSVATAPGASAERADFLLAGATLLAAPHGQDVSPLFLAPLDRLAFDPLTYSIVATASDGRGWSLGMLGSRSEDVLDRLRDARSRLAAWTATVLAAEMPALSASARAVLANQWAPGRLLPLDAVSAEARAAIQAWFDRGTRAAEATALQQWAEADQIWLGLTPPPGTEPTSVLDQPDAGEVPAALPWLLARRGAAVLIEAIGGEELATYHFEGGAALVRFISEMLCAPHFAREAVYAPLSELTGERADLGLAARHLPFLVELRQRFVKRIIHRDAVSWQSAIDALR